MCVGLEFSRSLFRVQWVDVGVWEIAFVPDGFGVVCIGFGGYMGACLQLWFY